MKAKSQPKKQAAKAKAKSQGSSKKTPVIKDPKTKAKAKAKSKAQAKAKTKASSKKPAAAVKDEDENDEEQGEEEQSTEDEAVVDPGEPGEVTRKRKSPVAVPEAEVLPAAKKSSPGQESRASTDKMEENSNAPEQSPSEKKNDENLPEPAVEETQVVDTQQTDPAHSLALDSQWLLGCIYTLKLASTAHALGLATPCKMGCA